MHPSSPPPLGQYGLRGMKTGLLDVAEKEPTDQTLTVAIGSRLRAVRKQTGLSLQAVQATSNQEFRASVLAAYERGERAISVPRLQRLARFYNLPVDQLLPADDDVSPGWADAEDTEHHPDSSPWTRVGQQKMSIDLGTLRAGAGPSISCSSASSA